jgi:hypothetical protein
MDMTIPIRWAPRVPRDLIRRLYERDAIGIVDEELIDEVAFALYARCRSIVDASHHRVPCPVCVAAFKGPAHYPLLREILRCPDCGWETTGKDYRRSVQGKLLVTQNRSESSPFARYPPRLEAARTPRERMLAIDWLIQAVHSQHLPRGRPVAVNLIEGDETRVMEFLDQLFLGLNAGKDDLDRYHAWRARLFLNSARSRRPQASQSEGHGAGGGAHSE